MRRFFILGMVLVTLAACGNPLDNMARLSDVETGEAAANVTPAPSEAQNTRGGLFGRLLNRTAEDPTNAAIEAALADVGAVEAPSEDQIAQAEPESGGLFGLFRRNGTPADAVDTAAAEAEIVEASVTPVPQEATSPRRGLAGLFRRQPNSDLPRTGPDATDVEPGAALAFGQIARVCGMRRGQMGTEIEAGGGFRLYDSNPSSTAPRPFYITGFSDDCARTFTSAVTVSGGVRSHEFIRYQGSNERIGYTTADNAYEALKASFCRVGRGQPCGERTDRLDRNTLFITGYSFFGGTFSAVPTKWAQILLHDGEVLAISIKEG